MSTLIARPSAIDIPNSNNSSNNNNNTAPPSSASSSVNASSTSRYGTASSSPSGSRIRYIKSVSFEDRRQFQLQQEQQQVQQSGTAAALSSSVSSTTSFYSHSSVSANLSSSAEVNPVYKLSQHLSQYERGNAGDLGAGTGGRESGGNGGGGGGGGEGEAREERGMVMEDDGDSRNIHITSVKDGKIQFSQGTPPLQPHLEFIDRIGSQIQQALYPNASTPTNDPDRPEAANSQLGNDSSSVAGGGGDDGEGRVMVGVDSNSTRDGIRMMFHDTFATISKPSTPTNPSSTSDGPSREEVRNILSQRPLSIRSPSSRPVDDAEEPEVSETADGLDRHSRGVGGETSSDKGKGVIRKGSQGNDGEGPVNGDARDPASGSLPSTSNGVAGRISSEMGLKGSKCPPFSARGGSGSPPPNGLSPQRGSADHPTSFLDSIGNEVALLDVPQDGRGDGRGILSTSPDSFQTATGNAHGPVERGPRPQSLQPASSSLLRTTSAGPNLTMMSTSAPTTTTSSFIQAPEEVRGSGGLVPTGDAGGSSKSTPLTRLSTHPQVRRSQSVLDHPSASFTVAGLQSERQSPGRAASSKISRAKGMMGNRSSSYQHESPPSTSSSSRQPKRSGSGSELQPAPAAGHKGGGIGGSESFDLSSFLLSRNDPDEFQDTIARHAEAIRRERQSKREKEDKIKPKPEPRISARDREREEVDEAHQREREREMERVERAGERADRERMQLKRRLTVEGEKVIVGNLIGEGHVNYVLMYNMLTGIRHSVSRVEAKLKQPLTDADFTARHKFSFDITGRELTPSAKYDFKFKDYAPMVFRELREHFHLDPADYLVSLTSKYILSELGSPGKSGSFFYFSRDYKFIIKTIRHTEHKFLRTILKHYHQHVLANPHTLLSRFYGLHRVKLPRGQKIHFLIMNNLFPPHRDVHETYDLKGSAIGREYPEEKAATNPRAVLKDLNWVHRGRALDLGPEKRAFFEEQLRADTEFLQKMGIMDYSLLVGFHDMIKGNRDNLRDGMLTVFQPDTQGLRRRRTQANKKEPDASALRRAVQRSDPKALSDTHRLPDADRSERRHFIFYQDEGGLRATGDHNEELDTIYYLGIIDILTPYTFIKWGEHVWKSFQFDSHMISSVPPQEYGDRFLRFLNSIIRGADTSQRPKME